VLVDGRRDTAPGEEAQEAGGDRRPETGAEHRHDFRRPVRRERHAGPPDLAERFRQRRGAVQPGGELIGRELLPP